MRKGSAACSSKPAASDSDTLLVAAAATTNPPATCADVRDIDGERRDGVVSSILESAQSIAKKRKVRLETQMINQDPPASCDDRIQAAIAASAKELGLSTKKMVSRAYHDSLFMARLAPTGMVFIPCKGGYSHRPDEFSSERDIGNGVGVLALTMAQLSEGTWGGGKDEL
jgi:ureidoglycolate amidohydrolase